VQQLRPVSHVKLWLNVGFAMIWFAGEAMWFKVGLGLVCFVVQAACQCSQQAGKNGANTPVMYVNQESYHDAVTVQRTVYITLPNSGLAYS
jgi:hypothetical protein